MAFAGAESLSIPAYIFPLSSNIEYEFTSAIFLYVTFPSLSLNAFKISSSLNLNLTYILFDFCASISVLF